MSWTEVSGSEFPWEREALDFVRERLPKGDAYRAWSNFEFIDGQGNINEVDLLVFSPRGAFLVEIKSWPQKTTGDSATWFRELDGGRRPRAFDNPLLLTNKKAKRLKGLLDEAVRRNRDNPKRLPYLQPLVFLSDPRVQVTLDARGRTGVCVRDREDGQGHGGFPGIVATLTKITAEDRERRNFRPLGGRDADFFSKALDAVGVRETTRHRTAGDWEIGKLLEEGQGWQEFVGERPDSPDVKRRIRIFGAASDHERKLVAAAARREFEILDPIDHPGILSPRELVDAQQGPALIYSYSEESQRLDHFLASNASQLTIDQRTSMVRQIAEALGYAHARGLTHRALKPSSIIVTDPTEAKIELKIRDWQLAHRATGETQRTGTLTAHADLLIEESADVYLAPEAGRTRTGANLDVFGLGAIAFLIFSGQPPAGSLAEREAHLRQHQGLDLAAVMDGAGEQQRVWLLRATDPEVSKRTPNVKEFLADLDTVEEELRGDDDATEHEAVDPTSATKGEILGGYQVVSRLGRGGTAIAYLVDDEGDERVLKVAASPANNGRIHEEGEVLEKVRDPSVVRVHRSGIDISGHAALVIDYAGPKTLAERIREDGPPGLELLERWGEDLIRAVSSLEQQGVAHRDIKPDNIGIQKRRPDFALRPVLFDFSLSRAPIEALDAGTPPYLDPFLRDPDRGRWDLNAERFSLAMTLHELATGQLPTWGDGESSPAAISEEVHLESGLFDPGVQEPLCDFFRKALARGSTQRFDSAEDMLRAWRDVFVNASETDTTATTDGPQADADEAFAKAAALTPLDSLPFSPRARSALRGAGINHVGDLIAKTVFELRSITGVGASTRQEILDAYNRLRAQVETEETPDVQSLDLLAKQLVPTKGWPREDLELLSEYLGLTGPPWRTMLALADKSGRGRAEVEAVVGRGRERWYKTLKSVRRMTDEIAQELTDGVGLLPIPMLEQEMLTRRGSVAQGDERARIAAACSRAACEAESYKEAPRFSVSRQDGLLVASLNESVSSSEALDYVAALGKQLDETVREKPIASELAAQSLWEISFPGLMPPEPKDLCQMAVRASKAAAINDRGEIYPIGMDAAVAIEHSDGLLFAAGQLSIDRIQALVRARFPEAAPLPSRPDLDRLVEGMGLEWVDSEAAYRVTQPDTSYTSFTQPSTSGYDPTSVEQFEERLKRSREQFLALTARDRHAARAEKRLSDQDDLTYIALDELLIEELRRYIEEQNAEWKAILAIDRKGSTDANWPILTGAARVAAERVRDRILSTPGTVLVCRAGLLLRYGCTGIIGDIQRQIEMPGNDSPLRGLWLLVPTDSSDGLPQIDGEPVPVLDRNDWTHIPSEWITSA